MTPHPLSSENAWIIFVTGMSGSGKSTVIQALEDEGFFCIDNLPPAVVKQAVDACLGSSVHRKHLAIVIDARVGDSLSEMPATLAALKKDKHHVEILFLDATDTILIRRFSETRRRHPLDLHHLSTVSENIAQERLQISTLRAYSTRVIETSNLSKTQLRELTLEHISHHQQNAPLSITISSFGYKHGIPIEADFIFDMRFLKNPFFEPELKHKTGLDQAVNQYVLTQTAAITFLTHIKPMMYSLLPLYQQEGKRYLHVAFGCTGGQHRSVSVAQSFYQTLKQHADSQSYFIHIRHRDIQSLPSRSTQTNVIEHKP